MSRELNNIEELLMDYLDGKLDKSKTAFVERYLANNPGVAEEIAGLSEIRLEPQYELKYTDKAKLKRTKEFKLSIYAKWAVAATGAFLVGSLIWLTVENNNIKRDYAILQKKSENYSNIIQSAGENYPDNKNNEAIYPVKIDSSANNTLKEIDAFKTGKRPVRSKYNMNTSNQTAVAFQEGKPIIVDADITEEQVVTSSRPKLEDPKKLETKRVAELANSNWSNPVILEESSVIVYSEIEYNNSIVASIMPFELAKMKSNLKSRLKDVNADNVKEKFKHAFQFQKLKEALVPSSVQQNDLTSIQ